MEDVPMPDSKLLVEAVNLQIPFGKYKGTALAKLPVAYLEWFARKGFPKGKLGEQLQMIYEIKINGLEYLLKDLKKH